MRATTSVLALAGLAIPLTSAMRTASGALHVLNRCQKSYDWQYVGDPRGGAQTTTGTLAAGGEYVTNWVQLNQLYSGGPEVGGFSLKLDTINDVNHPMQIEYTWPAAKQYVDGETISFDVSYVDLPKEKWDVTPLFHLQIPEAHGQVRDNYYRSWNDDPHAMQPGFPASSSATVILCPQAGDFPDGQLPPGYVPGAQAVPPTSAAAAPAETTQTNTYAAPSVAASTQAASAQAASEPTQAPAPTAVPSPSSTLVTTTSSTISAGGAEITELPLEEGTEAGSEENAESDQPADVVVTETQIQYVTQVVIETATATAARHTATHIPVVPAMPVAHRKRHVHGHKWRGHDQ